MLNPFPHLLAYHYDLFYSPTLFRLAASICFIYIAYRIAVTRNEIKAAKLPIVGHVKGWMIWLSTTVTMVIAFMLFIGFSTQFAAILGMLITLKHGLAPKRYESILPLSRSAYILLFVICLSLLFSGSGAYGSDWPAI
jgi:uncharacterized membrane protein YphA (DoxX/SURF4 family)